MHDVIRAKSDAGEELLVASVDCEKAFDSVSFASLLEPASASPYQAAVKNLTCSQRLRMDGTNRWFYPRRGTPQGGALSPALFNAAIERVHLALQKLPKVVLNGLSVNHLQWADDLIVIGSSSKDLGELIASAKDSLGACGLKFNPKKSNLLTINSQVTAVAGIKATDSLKYLGVFFNSRGIDAKKDFEHRKNNLLSAS